MALKMIDTFNNLFSLHNVPLYCSANPFTVLGLGDLLNGLDSL